MKRNDMIQHMVNLYEQSHRGGYSEMNDNERMDFILSGMETAGMLPPERVRYTDTPLGNTLCSPEFSWEPENET